MKKKRKRKKKKKEELKENNQKQPIYDSFSRDYSYNPNDYAFNKIGEGLMIPLLVFCFLGYTTGKVWNLAVIFIVVNIILFTKWGFELKKEQKLRELYGPPDVRAREEYLQMLYKKLEELEELEEEERVEKEKREREDADDFGM